MDLSIVNSDPKYAKAKLIEPSTKGYIYIAATVHSGPGPFVFPDPGRSKVLEEVKRLAGELERVPDVVKATVFRALFKPPTARFSTYLKEHGHAIHVADFDVFVLVETTSTGAERSVQSTAEYAALLDAMRRHSEFVEIIPARNARRIADVDASRQRLFLFNHFAAEDDDVMVQLWEYLADWYAKETGLKNSVALVPLEREKSDYAIVNWASCDSGPLRHFWRQLSRKSFWRYVTGNLEANHAASMPIYCRLA